MNKYLVLLLVFFSCQLSADDVSLEIMSKKVLTNLYSCPNNLEDRCTTNELDKTITHYLNQSHSRDQYSGEIDVIPSTGSESSWVVKIPSSTPSAYRNQINSFLEIGLDAFKASEEIRKAGIWEPEWRFFLQLGLPIHNNRAVHLLHFPPDTVLDTQDYLQAATIRRWGRLLIENGVEKDETPLYQPVADIAPVATKASDGESLTPTYPYFESYVNQMLEFLGVDENNRLKPVVAGGYPARVWAKDQFGVERLGTLDMIIATTKSGKKLPLLGSHHPSYIWYASKRYRDSNPDKAFKIDMSVMTADLIAACWKVNMSEEGLNDSSTEQEIKTVMKSVFDQCRESWKTEKKSRACELVQIDVYRKSASDAKNICENMISTTTKSLELHDGRENLDNEIENIEKELWL